MSDKSVEQFTPEAQAALARLLVTLADNKYHLGLRYAEWCNSAPALEAAVAAAALTQDELGHARSLYPLMRDFSNPPAEYDEDESSRDAYLNMACLEHTFATWAEFVAANSVTDQMLSVVFDAATDSAYTPLKQRAAKIMQEEYFHHLYAEGWCAQFKADDDAVKALQAGVDRLWPETAAWFGPADDAALSLMHSEGILNSSPALLRERFYERVDGLLGGDGIKLPIKRNADNWQADTEPDWAAWDAQARRLSE